MTAHRPILILGCALSVLTAGFGQQAPSASKKVAEQEGAQRQGSDPGHLGLARRLAHDWTRQAAVDEAAASGDAMTPLLLSWAENPPDGIMARFLDVGLADAFGRMKTEAAVPFLVRVIDLDRSIGSFAPWIKSAENIEAAYPAAAALIRIGPAGARAVIKAADGPMTREQRRLAIFVVARTKGVPEARLFLTQALAWANSEREWAEIGLKALEP